MLPNMPYDLIVLCVIAFCAGFIDSIVGGGGLLQMPALLIILPQYPVATIFGTGKIPSMAGTTLAAYKFSSKVNISWKLLSNIVFAAFVGSMLGAYCVSMLDSNLVKPLILIILVIVAIYTFTNKNFGIHQEKSHSFRKQVFIGLIFGFIIGFYDGLIGPGTGTFLILAFISLLGKDFLHASASAKYVNVATSLAALIYFGSTGHILYEFAIPMAVFNIGGSYLGTKLALLRGNKFIRIFFLLIVIATIIRFAYDIILKIK